MPTFKELLSSVVQGTASDSDLYYQNVRRRENAQRMLAEERRLAASLHVRNQTLNRLANARVQEQAQVRLPARTLRIAHVPLSEILGFTPQPTRRVRR